MSPARFRTCFAVACALLFVASALLSPSPAWAAQSTAFLAPVQAGSCNPLDYPGGVFPNAIVAENCLPGNSAADWNITGAGDTTIQGYATDISVAQGGTVNFKISTPSTNYHLDIYRMGYYAGNGARRVETIPAGATLPQSQPACTVDAPTKLIDCGNWAVSASWAVPADAVSGIYFAKAVRDDVPSVGSHIFFIVRDDDGGSDLLFQTSDTTWQAYNNYGGASLYYPSQETRAYKVSYNRPFNTRTVDNGQDFVFHAEYPMVRWLEANGYDVSYFTGVDAHRAGAEILEHEIYLSVGHDEYWSAGQRANVTAARDAGVNLAFFSGNEVFWKTRWEDGIQGSAANQRTLVSYKETHAGAKIDPLAGVWTGTWRDVRTDINPEGPQPENALTGQIFTVNSGSAKLRVPSAEGKLRLWRNSAAATQAAGGALLSTASVVGYEWDEPLDNGARPAGLFTLSENRVTGVEYVQDNGSIFAPGTATHRISLYRHGSGANSALVFGAGTVQWSWALDSNHDNGNAAADPFIQQATVNLFADMGVQPATLESGLIASPASTDSSAPTSQINAPLAGATVQAGLVTISGSAIDTGGGVVGGVEVSVDGGVQWHPASGRESWTYAWLPTPGAATILSRAVDDSGNLETPAAGIAVTVTPRTCPCSIWADTDVPVVADATDNNPIEVGVKFQAESAGYITHLRFYKGAGSTGTHVGHLWDSVGNVLAEATFTGESASGWQVVALSQPAAIEANTTYVASYYSPSGHYAYTENGLSSGVYNPPLRAPADGAEGGNGVFRYATSGFPSMTYNASNYWVDVVFATTVGPDQVAPTVRSVSPPNNATGVLPTVTLNALFSEALESASVTSASFTLRNGSNPPVAASVSYEAAARRVILHPDSPLAYATTYTARLAGGTGGITDAAGNPIATDYTWVFTTAAPPGPPPTQGPGGPILVISAAANPFSTYYAEILRAEGLNAFAVHDIATVDASVLANYQVAILGEMEISAAQAATLGAWVDAGGNLIAMRPDADLLPLLGLGAAGGTLAEGYYLVDTAAAPGAGIVGQTMQFHGAANLYTLNGATAVAMLYSNAATATTNPAVTLRSVGASGGQAAAFAFDLARSVVQTRQGNPAWAGQERDGAAPVRSNDMFFGPAATDAQPDWVNFDKIAIPQADEAQRLLANLMTSMNANQMPLPRFWYFPRSEKAVVVLTHDDHSGGNIVARLSSYNDSSTSNCVVEEWGCVRSTTYAYSNSQITDAQVVAFQAQGHDFSVHVDTGCLDFTPTSLETAYTDDIAAFAQKFPGAGVPQSQRTHCIAFSDWSSQPKTELAHGIRLDTNYYYWPAGWLQNRPGLFTGSGMPMRFADSDGAMIDVYQATTQMTDESGQSYPATINALLDRALGTEGYYGAFVSNQHTDGSSGSVNSAAIVASALARDVPLISASQLLAWVDGRNGSSFANLNFTGGVLTFAINVGGGANGLTAMLPVRNGSQLLTTLTRSGAPVTYTTSTVKGVAYAHFAAAPGAYTATYLTDATAPTVTALAPAEGATAVPTNAIVSATFSEPINPATLTAASFALRDGANNLVPATLANNTTTRTATLTPNTALAPDTTYTATLTGSVEDVAGNPLAPARVWSFTTTATAYTCPCSLWGSTGGAANYGDTNAYDLGVRFKSVVNGYITGVRFYRANLGGGAFTVSLWSNAGALLATAPGTPVTVAGWQEVLFSAPVAITANTLYVASYFAPQGGYSYTAGAFVADVTNGPLVAVATGGANGPNGAFAPAGGFPTQGGGGNYWVDVLFSTTIASDNTPPTIIQRTPAPAAIDVAADANMTVAFSEAMAAATINNTAITLRADGASADVAATMTYDAVMHTATLNPASDLAYATLYRVTVAGSVTDLVGNALGAADVWSFTTMQAPPPPPPGDDTLAQFAAGAAGACYLSATANGEIVLGPTVGNEFGVTSLPAGWDSYVWQTGGAATFDGAAARVDDAIIATTTSPTSTYYGQGRAIEFVATFANANFQHVGFGVDVSATPYWAMFSTFSTGQGLYARTNNNGAAVNTLLGTTYIGTPHRYRIEWGTDIRFYIDGLLVHTQNVTIARTMRPVISDSNSVGPAVVVDWLHMSPYGSPCTFTSRVIDAGAKVDWLLLSSTGDRPVGTDVAFLTRTGDSAVAGDGWSPWQAVNAGVVASPDGRYIQYQALLSTTNPDVTPEVASVAITNAPSNLPPVADDLNLTTAEETPVGVTLHAVDPEAGALTYAVTQPGHGTLSGSAPNLTYTPAADYNGSDSFTYTVNDGKSNSNTATVTLAVTPVNDAPVLAPIGSKTIDEEVQLAFTVAATDVDLPPGVLTFSIVGAPAGAFIDAQSGAFTWTPSEAQGPGSFTFTVRVTDNGDPALYDEESITVVVAEVNVAPVADDDAYSTDEDQPLVVGAPGVLDGDNDVDGNALNAVVAAAPLHGQLVLNNDGSFTYTPAANYNGSDSFTYMANDGAANSNTATVTLAVIAVNDAPVLAPIGDQTSAEGATIQLALTATDAEGGTLTFGATGLPPLLSINPATGAITGDVTFAAATNSPYAVTVTVTDNQGGTGSESLAWVITDFNRVPVATNLNVTTDEDVAAAIALVATDADNDVLTYAVTQPGHGTLSGSAPNLTYTPATNYNGSDSFTYTANDGKSNSNTATVTLAVTAVNDAPVLAPIGDQTSAEGETVTLQLSASDADGNPLTYSVTGLPPGLTYSTSTGAIGGQISYTAAAGSPWSVTATVSDNLGGTDSKSFAWAIGEVLPPRFALPTLTGVHGSIVNVPLSFTDATDFGGIRFAVHYNPAVLTLSAVTTSGEGLGWSLSSNLTESGVVTVSMATPNALDGGGTLVNLAFTVAGAPGATTPLAFGKVEVNGESVPLERLSNGSFSIPLASVAGAVRFWNGNAAVTGTTLTLAGSATQTTASADEGRFSFANVAGGAWTLTPARSGDVRGISGLDASLVLQSRVGLHPLTPAEALAADINESGAVDEQDAIAILRVAVKLAALPLSPGAHVWRFLPAERTYAPLLADQADQDFSAVLLGDVTGSWTPPATAAATPNSDAEATLDTAADPNAVADADAATLTLESSAAPDGTVDLLFTLVPGAAPVHAVDLLLRYNASRLEIVSAQVAQEPGQLAAVNLSQPGVARMGLASTTPLRRGALVATVRVRASGDPLAALLGVEATGDERPIQIVRWVQSPVRIFLPVVGR